MSPLARRFYDDSYRVKTMGGIAPIEEIIEEARHGRAYILVDAEDRENEGDVIVPARFATAAQINFMATHARGLVCLALTEERAAVLRLPPMTPNNMASHRTAFTVSIEAREGVTTGISAADRARTVAVAIDPASGADDLVSPGHVFPLVAKTGGVLVRAGHTEAAVDISRLAGLDPSGVICEVMNDDGSMARLPELVQFAKQHGLKVGAISDLIAYRHRNERCVERVAESPFDSIYGQFRMIVYRNVFDGAEHVALVKGAVDGRQPTLVRVHQVDLAADLLGYAGGRPNYVSNALKAIAAAEEAGVAVFIRDPGPDWLSERAKGLGRARFTDIALRDYGVGAHILQDLGVRRMILLTSSRLKPAAVEGYGLEIVERRPVPAS